MGSACESAVMWSLALQDKSCCCSLFGSALRLWAVTLTGEVCSFTPEVRKTADPRGGTTNSGRTTFKSCDTGCEGLRLPPGVKPDHEPTGGKKLRTHLKEQTPETPSLRPVTLAGRVRGFVREVSQTKEGINSGHSNRYGSPQVVLTCSTC